MQCTTEASAQHRFATLRDESFSQESTTAISNNNNNNNDNKSNNYDNDDQCTRTQAAAVSRKTP